MQRSALVSAAIALILAACSPSEPKPPETPEAAKPDQPAVEPSAKATEEPAPPPPSEVKRDARDSVPDDYQLTQRDCSELGKQYADVARADQMKGVSSKLSAKQREQAETNIDKVISKMTSQWTDTCMSSLVGKSVDPKGIKCALASKTVKEFDICLNGEQTPQPQGPPPKKKK